MNRQALIVSAALSCVAMWGLSELVWQLTKPRGIEWEWGDVVAYSNYVYDVQWKSNEMRSVTNYVIVSNRTVVINAGWFTNVLISDDFQGTIWFGDRFYEMSTRTNAP